MGFLSIILLIFTDIEAGAGIMKAWFEDLCNPESGEVKLCVEMSGNHQGSFGKALEFIEAIPSCECIAVKFQVYTPETITIDCDKPDFEIPKDEFLSSCIEEENINLPEKLVLINDWTNFSDNEIFVFKI